MVRVVRLLAVVGAAFVLLAGAPAVHAQEGEGEGDGFVPAETTPTTLPIDGEEVVPTDSLPPAPPTTVVADAPTTTALPAGCSPPPVPHAVFLGELTLADPRTGRFTVVEVRSGSLSGFRVGDLVDVDFEDDIRFLRIGEEYLVAAGIDDETGRLESKAKPALALFGGDAVVGVDDRDVVCPEFDDPAISRMADGASIETGVVTPLLREKSKILNAFLKPAAVAFGALVVIVALKNLIAWSMRRLRSWWRRRRAVAVLTSTRG